MDLVTLASIVQTSRLLTDQERQYWLSHLPRMKNSDLQKLETILNEANELKWNTAIPNFSAAQRFIPQSV